MLSPKSKSLYVEVGDFSILSATVSSLEAPFVIESLNEFPVPSGWSAFREHVEAMTGNKGVRFIPSRCAVYPGSRFFRRHTIESAAKTKDPGYFSGVLTEQLRVDLTKYVASVLSVTDGQPFSTERSVAAQKELLLCGAKRIELDEEQASLVSCSVYPESLELGTLSTLGALKDYMAYRDMDQPTLMLEITPETAFLFILTRDQIDICRPIPYGLEVMFPLIKDELGLKDEESARKLFYSNTFDFTEMGSVLLRRMLKELQASIGFYEVQTGQTIGQLFITLLPENLGWIEKVLSRSLGVDLISPDYRGWLGRWGATAGDAVQLDNLNARWLGLFGLMGKFDAQDDASQEG